MRIIQIRTRSSPPSLIFVCKLRKNGVSRKLGLVFDFDINHLAKLVETDDLDTYANAARWIYDSMAMSAPQICASFSFDKFLEIFIGKLLPNSSRSDGSYIASEAATTNNTNTAVDVDVTSQPTSSSDSVPLTSTAHVGQSKSNIKPVQEPKRPEFTQIKLKPTSSRQLSSSSTSVHSTERLIITKRSVFIDSALCCPEYLIACLESGQLLSFQIDGVGSDEVVVVVSTDDSTTATQPSNYSILSEIESLSSSFNLNDSESFSAKRSYHHNHLVPYHNHHQVRLNELMKSVKESHVSIVRLRNVSTIDYPLTSTSGDLVCYSTHDSSQDVSAGQMKVFQFLNKYHILSDYRLRLAVNENDGSYGEFGEQGLIKMMNYDSVLRKLFRTGQEIVYELKK